MSTPSTTDFLAAIEPLLPVLTRYARRLAGSALADDLVQETLFRAWRAHLRGAAPPRHAGYLCRILHNAFVSSKRKIAVRQRAAARGDVAPASLSAATQRSGSDPTDVLIARADAERVASMLDTLPPPQRRALLLVDVRGLTYREATDLLGVPSGTVMSRLHRGRRKLRATLAGP
ncbi:MAG: RNA polymerase sigma factor [Deltaproteobacteria bacterium]|nr:MAG: RNA polymerase sigma factor [Deltaproteobacteria bacterium]